MDYNQNSVLHRYTTESEKLQLRSVSSITVDNFNLTFDGQLKFQQLVNNFSKMPLNYTNMNSPQCSINSIIEDMFVECKKFTCHYSPPHPRLEVVRNNREARKPYIPNLDFIISIQSRIYKLNRNYEAKALLCECDQSFLTQTNSKKKLSMHTGFKMIIEEWLSVLKVLSNKLERSVIPSITKLFDDIFKEEYIRWYTYDKDLKVANNKFTLLFKILKLHDISNYFSKRIMQALLLHPTSDQYSDKRRIAMDLILQDNQSSIVIIPDLQQFRQSLETILVLLDKICVHQLKKHSDIFPNITWQLNESHVDQIRPLVNRRFYNPFRAASSYLDVYSCVHLASKDMFIQNISTSTISPYGHKMNPNFLFAHNYISHAIQSIKREEPIFVYLCISIKLDRIQRRVLKQAECVMDKLKDQALSVGLKNIYKIE
ncbi:hypothetical protein GJ496_004546 [Pomphorhynchus laevis]|nr:hypothetical protein GJ496_004546 [Pomphorhynchus laevis]